MLSRRGQTELLRLSRINFSEAFETLVHLKVIRTYIECLLRYGLPAAFFAAVLKVRHAFRCCHLLQVSADPTLPSSSRDRNNRSGCSPRW